MGHAIVSAKVRTGGLVLNEHSDAAAADTDPLSASMEEQIEVEK